jgi:hypothetical protein
MSNHFRKLDADEIAKIAESQGYILQSIRPDDVDVDLTCVCPSDAGPETQCRHFGTETWDFDSYVAIKDAVKCILVVILVFCFIITRLP